MASSYRTLDTDIIQVRTIYAKSSKNAVIPSSHILIADGNGATHWSSISTILQISSFRTIKGNNLSTFSADMSYNLLQISTTGVGGTLESYVDPRTSTLMLSNAFPPIGFTQGSVLSVTTNNALVLPNGSYMAPVNGNSTIKFLGVGDIQLSTVQEHKAVFISISSFTSAGYSTISGEIFGIRPVIASTLSTAQGLASFKTAIGYDPLYWKATTTGTFSTDGRHAYFSSMGFNALPYIGNIDFSPSATTKMFIEFTPSFFFSSMSTGSIGAGAANDPLIKRICTFVQVGTTILEETVTQHYITSQISATGLLSNSFQTPIQVHIDPYGQFSTNFNGVVEWPLTLVHRIDNAIHNGTSSGFVSTGGVGGLIFKDFTYTGQNNSAYLTMFSSPPLSL